MGEQETQRERVIASVATQVAYIVYAVGMYLVFTSDSGHIWRKFAEDFPGVRSILLIAALIAIALAIPKVAKAVAAKM